MVEDDQELDSAAPYRIVCEDWLAGLARLDLGGGMKQHAATHVES